MKKITFLLFLVSFVTFGQATFYGVATYQSKTDMKSIGLDIPNMDEATKASLIAKMSAAFEKTYVLNFTNYESTFLEVQKLQMESNGIVQSVYDGVLYKNSKEQIQISEIESFNKNFLITEPQLKLDWQLSNDIKKIGDFNCLKAIAVIPISEKELEEYEIDKKAQSSKQTSFIKLIEPKAKTITVYYTTEIPVSNGPSVYSGLPGLILELNDGTTTFLCSKIVLNSKDKIVIKRPSKGKKISRKEFEKMEEEKFNSMKDGNGIIQINAVGN